MRSLCVGTPEGISAPTIPEHMFDMGKHMFDGDWFMHTEPT